MYASCIGECRHIISNNGAFMYIMDMSSVDIVTLTSQLHMPLFFHCY